jgi:UDP-N-acetylmuramate dehydrogenase
MNKQQLAKELAARITGGVFLDEPLSRHTSMGVGGPAAALVYPGSIQEVMAVIAWLRMEDIAFLPAGNGTNLIVRDGGYNGVIIRLKHLQEWKRENLQDGKVLLHAQAGLPLQTLVNISMKGALRGIEFYAGVPGTVGGAIRMNAGAFGQSTGDAIDRLVLLNTEGQIESRTRETLHFSYRNLDLPEGVTILEGSYRINEGDKATIQAKVHEILEWRRSRHPLEYPNTGSIFKNPRGMPAGRLIEEAGLKGLRIGDAKISEKHGNFIENMGQASASDILALMDLTRDKVMEKSGIFLEPEVRIIGD